MKKPIIFLLLLFAAAKLYADDTAQLQAMINSGNTTLPANHAPYSITHLNLVHSLNANGNVINCSAPTGMSITMNNPGVKLSNAQLIGTNDSPSSSGVTAVNLNADNDTITRVNINKFSAYGIIATGGNYPVVTQNKISDVGYIGVFFILDKYNTNGGIFAMNTIDRSMIGADIIPLSDLLIRGGIQHPSTGWSVHDNVLIMPLSPKTVNAECFELLYCPHSKIYNNTCTGGSIGISVVRNVFVSVYHNTLTKQSEEGIEYADSNNGMIKDNIISNQLGLGMLVDGFPPNGCRFDTLLNNNIAGGKGIGLQLYKETHNIYIKDCIISGDNKIINIQAADSVTLDNCHLRGGGKAIALFLDNSAGKVTMKGGSIKGAGYKFYIYGTKQVVTDNILLDGVSAPEKPTDYDTRQSGGASAGSNIHVK